MQLEVDRLVEACGDEAEDGGIVFEAELEPLAGWGAPVKPAVYAGGRYQLDRRWVGNDGDRSITDVVVVDNAPSQANRLEAALARLAPALGVPEVVLDLSGVAELPPHLPRRLSGFRFPHRNGDAYLRDATLDGTPFPKTEIGRGILAATGDEPAELFRWFPQALLFGFWQSHLGKKRSQAKLARAWVSEIVGVEPASVDTRTLGIKGDPLNLSADEQARYDPNDLLAGWEIAEGSKKERGPKSQDSLAEIGHGQVPFRAGEEAPAAISFQRVVQRSTLSFPSLRRVWLGDAAANAAGRAVLASIGLVAHVTAFGRAFSLRSGCDLRPVKTTWTWMGASSSENVERIDADTAAGILRDCVATAEAAGVPVGRVWPAEPLVLEPGPQLLRVIRETWPELG